MHDVEQSVARAVQQLDRPSVAERIERLGYRPAQFAEAVGVTRQTVHNLIARGEIRAVKLGRATIIPASEAARLMGE